MLDWEKKHLRKIRDHDRKLLTYHQSRRNMIVKQWRSREWTAMKIDRMEGKKNELPRRLDKMEHKSMNCKEDSWNQGQESQEEWTTQKIDEMGDKRMNHKEDT